MNRVLRIITTLLVGIGFFYIFYYAFGIRQGNSQALYQPSYYTVRTFKSLFVSGLLTVLISMAGSFLSWFRQMDKKPDYLPNAIDAGSEQIETWLKDSTLRVTAVQTDDGVSNDSSDAPSGAAPEAAENYQKTEVIGKEDSKE